MAQACESFGLTFGIWDNDPQPGTGAQALNEAWALGARPEHYIAQAEQPRDWPAIVEDFRAVYPELPAAVVTTFGGIGQVAGGYDPDIAKPVIDAGFYCLTECYEVDNPPSTMANMDFAATKKLGWARSQPVLGCYHGYPAANYVAEGLERWPGYWVWLAETLTDADWIALRDVNLNV